MFRIGVMGEPSINWPLTLRVARICADEGKRVVIISRLLVFPHDEMILVELARLGATLNLTLCALDAPKFRTSSWLENYWFLLRTSKG